MDAKAYMPGRKQPVGLSKSISMQSVRCSGFKVQEVPSRTFP